jgi:single-strand DNA-binding protein
MPIEAAILGTLGRNAELKTSARGDPFVKFSVAVNDGAETQWVNVCAFDQTAVTAAADLTKGARVYAEGKLRAAEYTAGDGSKRLGLSLLANYCRPVEIGQTRRKRPRTKRLRAELSVPAAAPVKSPEKSIAASRDAVPFNDELPWTP